MLSMFKNTRIFAYLFSVPLLDLFKRLYFAYFRGAATDS